MNDPELIALRDKRMAELTAFYENPDQPRTKETVPVICGDCTFWPGMYAPDGEPGNADELEVPLIVAIKFRGSVDAVEAAMEAAKQAAENVTGVVASHIITRTEEDTEPMLKLNAFDKN